MKPWSTVGIIGFGRFGAVLLELLKDEFKVNVFDSSPAQQKRAGGFFKPLKETLSSDALFYCVPISEFESTFTSHLPYLASHPPRVIFDVLSVKLYAKSVFDTHLPPNIEAGLTHPLFGPDSIGEKDLPIVIDRYTLSDDTFEFWCRVFSSKGLSVIELSAEDHDRTAAQSQGLCHVIGRILDEINILPSVIDTVGARKLHEVRHQVCHDTWQLFTDLQQKNPFTLDMRVKLGKAQEKIYNALLPDRIHQDKLVVGIQGGRGSFNEEAALHFIEKNSIKDFELVYLHTTDRVLKALHEGEIDRGQFAIHNSRGGIVTESVEAMAKFNFEILEEFEIKIMHALHIRMDAVLSEIDTVMTHPQVLRQCSDNLRNRYPNLVQTSGTGDLVDHAKVAELLANGALPKTTATIGSRRLCQAYRLQLADENLQDLAENWTSFLWIKRPSL